MNPLARRPLAMASLAALSALGACAARPLSPWRHATVVTLVPPEAIPAGTDLQCVARALPAASAMIAVVRLRVGRAPYDEALVVPPDVTLRVGDAVRVRSGTCALRLAPAPAPAG